MMLLTRSSSSNSIVVGSCCCYFCSSCDASSIRSEIPDFDLVILLLCRLMMNGCNFDRITILFLCQGREVVNLYECSVLFQLWVLNFRCCLLVTIHRWYLSVRTGKVRLIFGICIHISSHAGRSYLKVAI